LSKARIYFKNDMNSGSQLKKHADRRLVNPFILGVTVAKDYPGRIDEAVKSIKDFGVDKLDTALILGSGLGEVLHGRKGRYLAYSSIKHFPAPTVAGHAGVLKICDGLAIMQGRFHYFEGYSLEEIVFPIFVLHKLGIKTLIVTNAAGALNPRYKPGDIVIIKDHISFFGESPLRGQHFAGLGPRFPGMAGAYSRRLITLARKLSPEVKKQGVYIFTPGPHFETRAEVKMLCTLGGDMVGMSTTPEVIAARFLGLEVLGFSCITNLAAGIGKIPLQHEKILRVGNAMTEKLSLVLEKLLSYLDKNRHES
jgi:purine-nucleoside phosphorylase